MIVNNLDVEVHGVRVVVPGTIENDDWIYFSSILDRWNDILNPTLEETFDFMSEIRHFSVTTREKVVIISSARKAEDD